MNLTIIDYTPKVEATFFSKSGDGSKFFSKFGIELGSFFKAESCEAVRAATAASTLESVLKY